jgi:tetratricopeptide (TPR) repeat protein
MPLDKNKTILLAQKYIQKGMYDRAIKELAAIIREDPKDIKVRQKLGDLYARENKKAEALAEYNYVAKYYADDGFYLRAIALYKQILKLDPSQITINLKLAELYHKQNLNGDAIQQFQLVYQYYERKGDTVRALETLDKMAEMAPGNLGLRMRLADAYYRNGNIDHSLDEYVKIGEQLKKDGRIDDVISLYEKLIKHHPQRLDMIVEVAETYLKSNKREMAEARIDMGLGIDPGNMKLLYLKSRLCMERNDHGATIEILDRIIGVDPEFIAAKEDLARIYEKLGKKDELEKIYTDLMISFRKKIGGEEKAAHYKALYDNLKSTISEDMMSASIGGVTSGEDEIQTVEELDDGDVIEVGEEQIVDAEIVEEIPDIGGQEEQVEESLDNEGRLVMLKVDTYVKYGQFVEAANVLGDYTAKRDVITPRIRLAELYRELADKTDDPERYNRLAAGVYRDIASIAKEKGYASLSASMRARAAGLGPADVADVSLEEPVEEIQEFDVVMDDSEMLGEIEQPDEMMSMDEIEVSESIDVGEIGVEPIEISLDEQAYSDGYETVIEDDELHEVRPLREPQIQDSTGSPLINMAPSDEPLADGEDYFDLRKELEEVVLDEDISLESKGGAGLLGKDDQYSFEDVFDEFKRGVQKQFGKEDYDTHYNLGIAYREMGLFEDAITEFLTAAGDQKKRLDSIIMLGVTHRDIDEYDKSIDYFREALDTPNIKDDERMGILYELALSCELDKQTDEALPLYEEIYSLDKTFRDVADKIRSLKGSAGKPSSAKPAPEKQQAEDTQDKPDQEKKSSTKGKISFV